MTAAQNLATAAEEMRGRDENAGAAFVTLLARWTDPSGFESQQRQEEARESEESQEGATTLAGLEAEDAAPTGRRPSPDMATDPAPQRPGNGNGNGGGGSGPAATPGPRRRWPPDRAAAGPSPAPPGWPDPMSTRPPTRDPRRHRAARSWSRRLAPGLVAAAVVPVVPVVACRRRRSTRPRHRRRPRRLAADGFGPGGWWWDAMGVDELQRAGTGKGVTVAVIDTPIDPDVPELAGKVARSSSPCLADGGGTMSPRSSGAEAEHGTTMAAIIGGTGKGSGPGGTGIRGIAPDATLLHYAVSYPNPDREGDLACGITGPGYDELAEGIIASIRAAVADGADIINLSVVSDYDADYGPALLEAYRAGTIVVAGTDNAGRGRHVAGARQRRRRRQPRRPAGAGLRPVGDRRPADRLHRAGQGGQRPRRRGRPVAQRPPRRRLLERHRPRQRRSRGDVVGPPRRHGQPAAPGRQGRRRPAHQRRGRRDLVPPRGQPTSRR